MRCIPFVLTYNPRLPNIAALLKKYIPLLHTSTRCRKAIPDIPMAAYRRPKNLRDHLVRSKIYTHKSQTAGFSPCQSKRCMTCPFTTATTTFTATTDNKIYTIRQQLTCTSYNIIYLITCTQCKMQYVGQTSNTLRLRMNGHRSDIKHKKDTPVARHFNQTNHTLENLHITPIEYLPDKSKDSRENKETFWINKLRTMDPAGINIDSQPQYPIGTIN